MYCIALYVLYCTVLSSSLLNWMTTELNCTVLCWAVLHCTVLYWTVLHCTALYYIVLCHIALYCIIKLYFWCVLFLFLKQWAFSSMVSISELTWQCLVFTIPLKENLTLHTNKVTLFFSPKSCVATVGAASSALRIKQPRSFSCATGHWRTTTGNV